MGLGHRQGRAVEINRIRMQRWDLTTCVREEIVTAEGMEQLGENCGGVHTSTLSMWSLF